jgi:HK97 family phage major capsid protein
VTITIPTKGDELEDFLSDSTMVSQLFNQNGTAKPEFSEFIRNYTNSRMAKDASLSQQIEEQVQAAVADLMKDSNVDAKKALNLAGKAPSSKRAPGAKADGVFEDLGEFLQASWHGFERLQNSGDLSAKRDQLREVMNSYGTQIPADGGFLVPEEYRSGIMTQALESAIVRPRATVIPMSTQTLSIPAVDETTHNGSLFGGVVAYRTAEGAQLTESQAKFARVRLDTSKLTAFGVVPNELISAAPAFMAWFQSNMPAAVAWHEDDDFTNGQGAGEPLGWRRSPALISVTRETGQASGGDPGLNTIVWENLIKMYARVLPTSMARAVWIASPDTFPQLATMALNVGVGGAPVWLNNGVEGPPVRILGRPVYFSEKVPSVGSAGDISLVDLSYYAVGDRQTMTMESSRDFKFDTDETAIRLISHNDGRPLLLSAITPANGGDTQSAFVNIAQRSS